MAHRRRSPACKQVAFQGSPGSGKTRQMIALFALFAHRYQARNTEFKGQPLPTWAYRLIRNWRNNPYVTGQAPRALPIAVSTPMRVTTTWEREIKGAYPQAEVMMIDSFRDVDAWMARCAVSTAPVVVAVFSQSKTRAFSLEWEPAVKARTRKNRVPVKTQERARRAVLVETPKGPSWIVPKYEPKRLTPQDEDRFLAFLNEEGVDTARPYSLSVEGVISFDAGDSYEIEEVKSKWVLHTLSPVEPLLIEGKVVGWFRAGTTDVITEEIDETIFFCPDCGRQIVAASDRKRGESKDGEEDELVPVTSITYFKKQQRTCRECHAPLWQRCRNESARRKWPMPTFAEWSAAVQQLHDAAEKLPASQRTDWSIRYQAGAAIRNIGSTPASRRIAGTEVLNGQLVVRLGHEAPSDFSPFEYVHLKYPGCVAHHAADEAHNARGANTDIARSIHYAWRSAQTYSLLSGTISGGMLDGLYHLLYRFKPSFWQRLGLGWGDLEEAIRRYGFTQETVSEHQSDSRKGSGAIDVRVSVVPAPGMSAKLLPMLLESMIFIDAERDLGSFMPDLEEIPDVVDMADPAVEAVLEEAKTIVVEAETKYKEAHETYKTLMNDAGATDHERATAQADLDDALAGVHGARQQASKLEERAASVNLAAAYDQLTNWLEEKAKDRVQAAILAKGMLPRWWSVLPCVHPAFKVVRTLRGEWGDVEGQELLYQAPVLAEDYRYPLEKRLIHHVEEQLGMDRSVMIYIEQNDVRSTPKRLEQVLAAFAPWTLPNNTAPEDREDAIREAYNLGRRVFIVPYRRVSEGLNLQFLDTVIWYEMAMNYYHLRQSNQRIQRLGATNLKQVIYLVYRGSVAHRKLIKLGEQSGSASLFAGDTPEGELVKSAGADRTTLARMSASVEQVDAVVDAIGISDDDLRAVFAERSRAANAARRQGRTWIGVEDTLPSRLAALRAAWSTRTQPTIVTQVPEITAATTAITNPPAAPTKPAPAATKAPAPAPRRTPAPANRSKLTFGDPELLKLAAKVARRDRAKKAVNTVKPQEGEANEASVIGSLFDLLDVPEAPSTSAHIQPPAAASTQLRLFGD